MKRLILALCTALSLSIPPVFAQPLAPFKWELAPEDFGAVVAGFDAEHKIVFKILYDGVIELGEGQTPKTAAEFLLANTPHQCPTRMDMQYFPLVLGFRNDNKGGIGWQIKIDYRGNVSYAGLDYVGPNLAEFMNIVADAMKCE